jgi:hypothetical protein
MKTSRSIDFYSIQNLGNEFGHDGCRGLRSDDSDFFNRVLLLYSTFSICLRKLQILFDRVPVAVVCSLAETVNQLFEVLGASRTYRKTLNKPLVKCGSAPLNRLEGFRHLGKKEQGLVFACCFERYESDFLASVLGIL